MQPQSTHRPSRRSRVLTRRNDAGRCRRGDAPTTLASVSRRLLGSGFDIWSGREDLNLDYFPGRKACCNYTTSAKPASYEPDTFVVWTTSRTIRAPHDERAPKLNGRALPSDVSKTRHLQS